MTDVNGVPHEPPQHLAYLLHMATRRLRAEAETNIPPSLSALQAAQARLLDLIPDDGARASDLALTMRVSKQGLGQLVTQLTHQGYVDVRPDPHDRRARLVCCTERGELAQQVMRQRIAEVEGRWRAEVGSDRYDTFRQVLLEVTNRYTDPTPGRPA